MPPGTKKRKSSKKKKKLGGNSNNNNNALFYTSASATNSHFHDEEVLIHDGDQETDSGEFSFSASRDHQFNYREKTREKQLEISHSESSIDKNKSNALKNGSNKANIVAIEEGGTIQLEKELKLEGESMSHNINIDYVEPTRFPREGGLQWSSSSSSKPAMSKDIVRVTTSASDIDIVALHSIGSSEKENEKRELGVMDEKTRASDVFMDTGLEKRDNKAVATSDVKISVALKDDNKRDLSYDAPAVDASVHADDMNGSPHDHQPLVALVPRPVQTTSWKSCCGLFEVFAGSNK
ncbi:hypothetical protein HAX54_012980 [Datura stramonium]|uniref:Uncharacterized protein n=1 Tax=Datura stramonium TaxID=4076 RepID=A0ABS8S1A9_DATST|nr:hypothetical protein [Datura stramonium]